MSGSARLHAIGLPSDLEIMLVEAVRPSPEPNRLHNGSALRALTLNRRHARPDLPSWKGESHPELTAGKLTQK